MRRREAVHGFTLIEVLVVVVILALTATFVVVKLQPDDRATLREEALRLSVLLQQARDEAIASGASVAWRGEPGGYGFMRRNSERRWEPIAGDDVFRARRLPEPMRMTDVEIGGRKAQPEDVLVFTPSALNQPYRIVLSLNAYRLRVRSDHFAQLIVENDE
jgi:general secretion pathway protein H